MTRSGSRSAFNHKPTSRPRLGASIHLQTQQPVAVDGGRRGGDPAEGRCVRGWGGMCASITETWGSERGKGGCRKCSILYLWLHLCSFLTWLPKRNQASDTQGQMTLTSPDAAPPFSGPGVLVSFPLMASATALTLLCDSSLQQSHPQPTTG